MTKKQRKSLYHNERIIGIAGSCEIRGITIDEADPATRSYEGTFGLYDHLERFGALSGWKAHETAKGWKVELDGPQWSHDREVRYHIVQTIWQHDPSLRPKTDIKIADVKKELQSVENLLLDGEQYLHGRDYVSERECQRLAFSVPRIIAIYDAADKRNIGLLSRVFYLARSIDAPHPQDLEQAVEGGIVLRLREIAEQGRERSLNHPKTDEERIALAKLYKNGRDIFAAQVQDPKRGCSASICTNCEEPIAFCDYECRICDYELINAHKMPRIEEWKSMNAPKKLERLTEACQDTITDIWNRGDWRSEKSPLNRFKQPKMPWGGLNKDDEPQPLKPYK